MTSLRNGKTVIIFDSVATNTEPTIPKMSSIQITLPIFGGHPHEDVKFFVSNFNAISQIEKWENEKKIVYFKSRLMDKALQFILDSPTLKVENNFEKLSNALIEKFKPNLTHSQLQQNFFEFKQGQNQSVQEVHEKVGNLAAKFLPSTTPDEESQRFADQIKLNRFLNALHTEIRVETLKQGPKTFDQAVKIAKDIEAAFKILPDVSVNAVSHMNVNPSPNLLQQQQLEIDNLKAELAALQINQTQQHSNDIRKPVVTCHICGKPHVTTRCWYYPKMNPSQAQQSNVPPFQPQAPQHNFYPSQPPQNNFYPSQPPQFNSYPPQQPFYAPRANYQNAPPRFNQNRNGRNFRGSRANAAQNFSQNNGPRNPYLN